MQIVTFSIVTGSAACNAACPFCVSKMTVPHGTPMGKAPDINWRNFDKAAKLAQMGNCTTVLFTGKGEPTLFPDMITAFMSQNNNAGLVVGSFPFVEIQTNGIPIWKKQEQFTNHLREWYRLGLTTVAISCVHFDPEINRKVYMPYADEYIDLPGLISFIKERGLMVRLTTVMIKGGLDSPEEVQKMIMWSRNKGVDQLTFRPVNKPLPGRSSDDPTYNWISENGLSMADAMRCQDWVEKNGSRLMEMPHGAVVYDVGGQNVCMTDCLTHLVVRNDMRQLIYYPNGRLAYDWQFEGAVLL